MPTLAQKTAYWEGKLLDLSKNNRMLHFRETKRGSLVIESPNFFDLFKAMVKDEKNLVFQHPIGRDVDSQAYYLLRLMELAGSPVDVYVGDIRTNQSLRDQMLTVRSLRNKAQLAFDEQGTNLLYLSFGFVHWYDGDKKSGDMNSPFLLVPVVFTSTSSHDFGIKLYDDDITINPTLAYALEQKKHFTFPEFDPEKNSFSSYIGKVTELLEDAGMHLEQKCCLGMLSFLKINMYLDLKHNNDRIAQNPVLRQIYTSQTMAEKPRYDLDAEPYEERVQVLSADSSQLDAIVLSRQGRSFVLQGPPGTGKSQTITNIIAQALADRKKVLFVSEKMAALQVVYRRLEEVGLADFCLPLHDYKADKKQILHQIAKPLTLKKKPINPSAKAKLSRLEMLKRKLNHYSSDLHTTRSEYQISMYDAISRLQELSDIPSCSVDIREPHRLDRLTVLSQQASLAEFGRIVESLTIAPKENPWFGYRANSYLPEVRNKALELIETYLQAVNDSMLLASKAREEYHLPVESAPRKLQHEAALLNALVSLPILPQAWLDVDTEMLKAEAERQRENQRLYNRDKSAIETFFVADVPVDNLNDWIAEYDQAESRLSRFGLHMDSLPASREAHALALEKMDSFIQAWEEAAPMFWNAALPTSRVGGLYYFLARMSGASVFSSLWLNRDTRREAIEVFRKSLEHEQNRKRLRALLDAQGSTAGSKVELEQACLEWEQTLSGEIPAVVASVLRKAWEQSHPNVFSSFPGLSCAAWNKRMDQLVESLSFPSRFSFSQVETYLEDCTEACHELEIMESICDPFTQLFPDKSYDVCAYFLEQIPELQSRLPMPFTWTKQSRRETVATKIAEFSGLQKEIRDRREQLLNDYYPSVFSLDAPGMLNRFEQDYTSFLGWLKPQKKKDLNSLQACRKSVSSSLSDTDACNVLRALCQVKSLEASYQSMWTEYRADVVAQSDIPEDWDKVRKDLLEFGVFCQKEENAYIESLTEDMFRAIPAVSAKEWLAGKSRTDKAISSFLGDRIERKIVKLRERMELRRKTLTEIVELFSQLDASLVPDCSYGQAYSVMQSLSKEQRSKLAEVEKQLEELEKEDQAFLQLRDQRERTLAPVWVEDAPRWEEIGQTLDILSDIKIEGVLASLSALEPDITIERMHDWFRKVCGNSPAEIHRLVHDANSMLEDDTAAREVVKILQNGVREIDIAQRLIDTVSSCAPSGAKPSAIAMHMKYRAEYQQLITEQDSRLTQNLLWFGDMYAGWSTDWDRVIENLTRWYICISQFPEIRRQIDIYRPIISSVDRDNYAIWVDRTVRTVGLWLDTYAEIETYFDEGVLSGLTQVEREERLVDAADHMEYLDQWLSYALGKRKIAEAGLETVIAAFEKHNISPSIYGSAYEKAFLIAWINQTLSQAPELTRFKAREMDSDIAAYRELCQDYLEISRARLQAALIDSVPQQEAGGEMAILKKELSKKAKLMPLRKLFRQIPYLLLKLKPCLMMSPLSVSYFLDSDFYHFDMVIFDEASQIFPQDAIGAILRGNQAIIAGDTRQMPPTDFFSVDLGEEEDEDDQEISTPLGDSILEEADYTLTSLRLLWHYRSRDEQLIAFSNQHFYEDLLYTFPGNVSAGRDTGVEYVFIPDGVYYKRHNDKEAEMCLKLIREHYKKTPTRSLGVVAFNEAQQSTIENLVWEERERDPAFAAQLDANAIEPFFIKNLENVQGDERDTIIFSICFGKAPDGRFRYNFGPLGKAGGERRLNVAVTRAKFNVKLVCSIHASDIDLGRAKSEGAKLLKYYIDYASHPETHSENNASDRDAFIDTVADRLKAEGYTVQQNVGRSAYKVDIAVCSKESQGQFIAAVQCDGRNYSSARTACDREDIRRTMLENLDWRIVNCWSTDWFIRPNEAQKRLVEQLKRKPPVTRKQIAEPKQLSMMDIVETQEQMQDVFSSTVVNERKLPEYKAASEMRYRSSAYPADYSEYMRRIMHCISWEQPISQELLYKRMAPLWDRQVVSNYVRDQVNLRIEQLGDEVRLVDGYFVLKDFREAQARTAGDRDIEQISILELVADLAFVIQQSIGMERQDIISTVARLMGYQRTGSRIISRLNVAMEQLYDNGKITIVRNKVQWKE